MRRRLPKALLAAGGLVLLSTPAAEAAIPYAACPRAADYQCATLTVPLDRTGRVGGAVRLAAVRRVAPANPTRAAVVALAGGPGQPATPIAREFATVLAPALGTRDLLVFDQRGTGASTPLQCRFGLSLTLGARRCAAQLGRLRGLFTTAASVDDLEALRAESGYERLTLYGVSYGTKLALDYAARHPARVEALVLDSVVLPAGPDPFQRSTFAAMPRVLRELCAGGACTGITRRPTGDLAGTVRRLRRAPLRGLLTNSRGRRVRVAMDRRDLLNILLHGDLNPTLRAELPAALTSARRGDRSPLLRLAARSAGLVNLTRQAPGQINDGVFAATICEEGAFPWDRAAAPATRARQAVRAAQALGARAFRPFDRSTALDHELFSLCIGWPVASPPPAPAGPVPDVPTLVLNGAADLRTPLEDAARVRQLVPRAQVLAVPFSGHSVLGGDVTAEGCAQRAVGRFFGGQAVAPCTRAPNPFAPTPVAPTRLDRLRPTGPGGKAGRTITAALRTTLDMRRQVIGDTIEVGRAPRRVAGLRGGRATVSRAGTLGMRRVQFVPGVLVSGSASPDGEDLRLRIGGRAAARGSLHITPARITGRLGGRRIDLVARGASFTPPDPPVGRLLRRFRLRRAG